MDKSLKPNSFWIQESGDDPQNWERNSPKANRFHYTITPDKQSAERYKQMGINAEWISHWADTAVQFPLNLEPEFTAVTTRGPGNSEFLDYLTRWGEGAIGNKNGMGAKEHTEFLNKGLMVIQNSRWKEITRRIFEGMACGKMVLTDNLPPEKGLRDIFIDGEDIVYYDDMFDCIEKMNYYNENGILNDNSYERVSIRSNNEYRVSDRLKFGNNIGITRWNSNNKPFSLFTDAYNAAPIYNAKNADVS